MKVFYTCLMIGLFILAGCSTARDTAYLTPIPEATISAYRDNMPVDSKLQAAIAAQVIIRTSRLDYEMVPKVISVEEMTLAEAQKKVRQLKPGDIYHEDRAGDTKVWLVMLKGEYRIIPPDPEHTYTPEPLAGGCISVIVDQDGRSELMAAACAE